MHMLCVFFTSKIENVHNKYINDVEKEQIEWLDCELLKSKDKKKIIFGHYPIISNGLYEKTLEPFFELLFPILKKHNINAYISGHEHNIQYIKKEIDYFNLHQFIIGSTSKNRIHEHKNIYHNDMYDNQDNYIMVIYKKNNKLYFDFINGNKVIKYSYTI